MLERNAYEFARRAHGSQTYGSEPYTVHLEAVAKVMERFGVTDHTLLAAAYLHDVLEDTNVTLEQLSQVFPESVVTPVWLVTEPKGKNRIERHAVTYPKIRSDSRAILLKLADRIANFESGGKTDMYINEYAGFKSALFDGNPNTEPGVYQPTILSMWKHLDNLTEQAEWKKVDDSLLPMG